MPVYRLAAVATILFLLLAGLAAVIIILVKKSKKGGKKRKNKGGQKEDNVQYDFDMGMEEGTVSIFSSSEIFKEKTESLHDGRSSKYKISIVCMDDQSVLYEGLLEGGLTVGRNPQKCQIIIENDTAISNRHCFIEQEGGILYISDLESSNGTYVDEQRIGARCRITSESKIKLGRHLYKINMLNE